MAARGQIDALFQHTPVSHQPSLFYPKIAQSLRDQLIYWANYDTSFPVTVLEKLGEPSKDAETSGIIRHCMGWSLRTCLPQTLRRPNYHVAMDWLQRTSTGTLRNPGFCLKCKAVPNKSKPMPWMSDVYLKNDKSWESRDPTSSAWRATSTTLPTKRCNRQRLFLGSECAARWCQGLPGWKPWVPQLEAIVFCRETMGNP